jgi:hypothetical protein
VRQETLPSQVLNKHVPIKASLRGRSRGKTKRVMGILLDEERIRIISPPLNQWLEEFRILEKIDLEKEFEPTTYPLMVGRRVRRH